MPHLAPVRASSGKALATPAPGGRRAEDTSNWRWSMTSRRLKWLIGIAATVLLAAGLARAQSGRAGTPAELMAALKAGQWVKIEGPAGNTPVVQCSEAKMLTGDFLDGDWQITADVRRVDA